MDIQIFVAAHKMYRMPDNNIYQPIFVGSAINGKAPQNYQPDNVGQNISKKNPNYNELTAMYWAWKNCHADVKGLVQYRRYFSNSPKMGLPAILNRDQVQQLLSEKDVIVPKKREYYIETNYSHYAHAHHAGPLNMVRQVIQEKYPAYLSAYDGLMKKTGAHMFNMMVMPAPLFDGYAEWLFSILFEVESRVDISDYDQQEARVFGYLSELLLDVWLTHNQLSVAEVPVMYMEKQRIPAKAYNLLKRKFFPRAVKQTHF